MSGVPDIPQGMQRKGPFTGLADIQLKVRPMDVQKKKIAAATLSIVSNSILIVLKLFVGIMTGAVSIISEAIHSGIDLLAAFITFFSVKTSGKPADREHPFGHGKIENISGTIEALLIFAAAIWILYEATGKLLDPRPIKVIGWGIGVMLFSTVVNLFVSERLFRVGRESDSIALQADAWHLRTDVYTSAGVMIGLVLILAGKQLVPGITLEWIDPVAAYAVAALIMHTAWRLTVQSGRDLLDASLPEEERRVIHDLIASFYPEVHGVHKLRTRKAGTQRFIEFHMKVNPRMSVENSHELGHRMQDRIREIYPGANVVIHTEPCDGTCDRTCVQGCMLPREQQREIHRQRLRSTRHA